MYSYGFGPFFGSWANDTVSFAHLNRLRTGLSLTAPNASAWTESYGYDSTRRMKSISSPAGAFGYVVHVAAGVDPPWHR